MAERVAHDLVGQHPGVPGVRQGQDSLVGSHSLINRLHQSRMPCPSTLLSGWGAGNRDSGSSVRQLAPSW